MVDRSEALTRIGTVLPRMTAQLAAAHLAAYRAQGFDTVALRDDEKLELGQWPLETADPAVIHRHALNVAKGQRDPQRVQLVFRSEDAATFESELYEVHDQVEGTETELVRAMLVESHEHIRKMHTTLERLAGAQVAALSGMWDFSTQVVQTSAREREELLAELGDRRANEDGGDRAMRIVELVISVLGPQAAGLLEAMARAKNGEAKNEETHDDDGGVLRGGERESESSGTVGSDS